MYMYAMLLHLFPLPYVHVHVCYVTVPLSSSLCTCTLCYCTSRLFFSASCCLLNNIVVVYTRKKKWRMSKKWPWMWPKDTVTKIAEWRVKSLTSANLFCDFVSEGRTISFRSSWLFRQDFFSFEISEIPSEQFSKFIYEQLFGQIWHRFPHLSIRLHLNYKSWCDRRQRNHQQECSIEFRWNKKFKFWCKSRSIEIKNWKLFKL